MTTNNIKEPIVLTIGEKYILKQYDTSNKNLFDWHDAFYTGVHHDPKTSAEFHRFENMGMRIL